MRIGYEGKRAFFNMTGLGNYCRGIIKAMAHNHPENEYFLYTPRIIPGTRVDFIKDHKRITVITPKSERFGSLWRSKYVVKDLKAAELDIYHGLSHELPIGIEKTGIKSVVTIHDLIFKKFPKYFSVIDRNIYSAKIKHACNHADKIVAMSERTKQDLIDLLNVDQDKIEVIYQDCDDMFRAEQTELRRGEVKLKYNLPKKFILTVGTIEERKNLFLLVKAFKQLPTDTRLVVIGKETDYAKKIHQFIARNQLGSRILFISNASFSHLPTIYKLADVFVYPSRYEGFGIPILEALVSGVPVIAATGSCLEEAGGPDSIYVNPDNENELAEKLKMLLSNPALQKTMIEKGEIYAQKFESKKLSAQLMALYQNLAGHA